ncbi:MAG: hypothetical protein JRN67_07905 [Nitrososphaerota archaeon]|jgi:hypothetical protein|nr:hypothetical protein [Nitrososphaerota archaeon]
MSMRDSTAEIQEVISKACSEDKQVRLEKGDYAIQGLTVPKNCHLVLFSKDRVRILFIGKRNRPMFILEDNSSLMLQEKLELYYNTNNIHELNKLMIRCPPTSHIEISKGVKISLFSMKQ